MASKAMAARLAAKIAASLGDEAAPSVGVDSTDVGGGGLGADESTDTSHITEAAEGATPVAATAKTAKVEPEEPATEETPEAAAKKATAARLALFQEKLKGQQEKRQAQRLAEQAKADRKAAQDDREAAKAERARYDGLKTGSYKETLEALGRDPRKTFEEMSREAIEASTPEAAARREKAEAEKALNDRLSPMQQEIERLRAQNAEWAARAEQQRFAANYQRAAAAPEFKELSIEYPGEALLEHAQYLIENPAVVYQAAKTHNIRLPSPETGFTMHELFQVMSAVQTAHNTGVQARRAALSPAEPQSAQPTVNGTAPRRGNPGTAIGNELASQRVSGKAEVSNLSPRDRLRERIDTEIRRTGG